VNPNTGGAPSSRRVIQDCDKWLRSLEKIRKAGGKIVEGFGRNGHRHSSHRGKHGGYNPKKQQGPAKWVHADATGLTKKMWRSIVELVDTTLNDMNTPSKMTATVSSTQESASHEQNAATPSIVGARTDNSSNMGSTTNNSPLTMLEFSDIEMEGECERDTRKRGGRNVFMAENGYAVGTDDEENDDDEEDENDYEDLDEDVLSGLLGLTEMSALN
jgi:hypothetical protein